jgi:transposase
MPPRSHRPLTEKDNEIVVLKQVGKLSNVEIARRYGVTEGAIRYRLKRRSAGKGDGRRSRPSQLDRYRGVITGWLADQRGRRHRETIKLLYDMLGIHHGYGGSYDALRRYMRRHYPELMKKRLRVRVETPPGRLAQVDWKEGVEVQLGSPGNWVELEAFLITLGFSRRSVMVWSEGKDLFSWLNVHNRAYRKLGGLPEVERPDCVGSAVVKWNGERSELNEGYRKYLSELGVLVFPSRPGRAEDKGKIEKRIRDIFGRVDLRHQVFRDFLDLERQCDAAIEVLEEEWRCGATGLSVAESFRYERRFLRPLPDVFPLFPVREERCRVSHDMTVYFMGNYYQLSRRYVDRWVLCTFTGDEIVIRHEGEELGRFAHLPQSKGMVRLQAGVLMDQEIHMSDTVRNWALEVASRQVEIYHEIIEGRPACR